MPLTIHQPNKATGIWHVKGSLGGERIRKSLGTCDRQAAKRAAAAIEREYWADRASGKAGVVTFETAALSYMQADGDRRFIVPLLRHFAGWPVGNIMAGHVEDAARELYPGRKPATWNRNVVTPMRAVLRHAAKRGWCSAPILSRFEETKVERRAANREWLDAFMAEADPVGAALALFMFTTGARISDALSLTWDNVKERRALIKTKTGPREAVLSREMLVRLAALPRDHSRVFRYKSRSSVYNWWYGICDQAGIERLRPHEAGRHAFATEMIVRRGQDAQTTAKLGGWASTRMLDRYAHPEALEETVDEVFGAPKAREVKDG